LPHLRSRVGTLHDDDTLRIAIARRMVDDGRAQLQALDLRISVGERLPDERGYRHDRRRGQQEIVDLAAEPDEDRDEDD
jgi:hypothetical protein